MGDCTGWRGEMEIFIGRVLAGGGGSGGRRETDFDFEILEYILSGWKIK